MAQYTTNFKNYAESNRANTLPKFHIPYGRTTASPCFFSLMDELRINPADCNLEKWKLQVLDTICHYFNADKGNFVSQHDQGPPIQLTRNTLQQNNTSYLEHYYALDPLRFIVKDNTGLQLAAGPQSHKRVVLLADVVDQSTFKETEYYNDFLQPQQVAHEAIVYLKTGKQILGILSIMRQSFEEFSSEDISMLKMIEPFLAVCLENALLHHENRRHCNVLNVFEDQTNSGIILLNSKTEVIYINQQAENLLQDIHMPLCDAIAHPIEENCKKLKDQKDYWNSTYMIPPINFHLQVVNQSVPAWMRYFPEDHYPEADGYYAIVLDPSKGQSFNHKKIQSHFLLTKREAEIIDGIFRGLKNIEIAEELYIGETTVKKHVQNICAKMNIRNRTAIIYKILTALGIT